MQDRELFARILGLESPWEVADVQLDMETQEVRLEVVFTGKTAPCPECGRSCSLYDHAPERRWRHLDTCQMKTQICSRTPRVDCPEHNVRRIEVPWAEPHGRFTLLMEWVCIQWLLACRKQSEVAKMMRLSPDEVRHIMAKAVERGLERREDYPIEHAGIDEKSMKRGHRYLTVLSDTDAGTVIDVAENRDEEAASTLLNALLDSQKCMIKSITMDMWPAFMNAAATVLPDAAIVHDRYHISAHLNAAIDQTRRREYRLASEEKKESMKGSRYLFARNLENLPDHRTLDFFDAYHAAEQTATAYLYKEVFRGFWTQRSRGDGAGFLGRWIDLARQQSIAGLTRVANMLDRHRAGVLNYLDHRTTNAVAEMLNGKIQELKHAARGFRSFAHYRTHILFHLANLDLNPLKTQ